MDLIEKNMVDVVVSTGAIISQDFYQVRGGRHFHGDVNADDKELRDLYIDRLYDTFIDEEKYWETDLAVSKFADALSDGFTRAELEQLMTAAPLIERLAQHI